MYNLEIEYAQEADGRWIAEITAIPGVLAYGNSRDEAVTNAQQLASRVIASQPAAGLTLFQSSELMSR